MAVKLVKRWTDYTVSVSVKRRFGSFGSKTEYVGEFHFCARDPGTASKLAAGNVRTKDLTEEVRTQIVCALPV